MPRTRKGQQPATRLQHILAGGRRCCHAVCAAVYRALRRAGGSVVRLLRVLRVLGRWWPASRGVRVEVLVVDPAARRRIGRAIRRALGRLRRVLGASFPQHLTVVVQRTVYPGAAGHELVGCCQVGQRPDGTRFSYVRLALEVDGEDLTDDDLLAALAEQCLGLAGQQPGGACVLIPLERGKRHALRSPETTVSGSAAFGSRSGATPANVSRTDPLAAPAAADRYGRAGLRDAA